jgi:hypothetical protein
MRLLVVSNYSTASHSFAGLNERARSLAELGESVGIVPRPWFRRFGGSRLSLEEYARIRKIEVRARRPRTGPLALLFPNSEQ